MKCLKKSVALLLLFLMLGSCKKGESKPQSPSNLEVTTKIRTDGSGKVTFTATAHNAVSFTYDFGNGVVKTTPSGIIDYQYNNSGSNTYTVIVTASNSSGQSIKKSIDIIVNVQPAMPVLVWSDEFNTDGAPDPTKWGYDIGTGGNGWGNNELEYYTSRPENAIVQNGVLKITAIKESYSGSAYTSARLLSKDKFAFTYGKIEVKAKLPAGVGTWPAIWMLGSDIAIAGWPACGEIDIMEHRGSELNKIFGTLHYPGRSGGNADGGTTVISNATTEFHIYSLEWSASSIQIYVDGLLYHTVNNSGSIPFNHDFFFIMNVAMGGGFAGNIDPAFTKDSMEVDYIRVYK